MFANGIRRQIGARRISINNFLFNIHIIQATITDCIHHRRIAYSFASRNTARTNTTDFIHIARLSVDDVR